MKQVLLGPLDCNSSLHWIINSCEVFIQSDTKLTPSSCVAAGALRSAATASLAMKFIASFNETLIAPVALLMHLLLQSVPLQQQKMKGEGFVCSFEYVCPPPSRFPPADYVQSGALVNKCTLAHKLSCKSLSPPPQLESPLKYRAG